MPWLFVCAFQSTDDVRFEITAGAYHFFRPLVLFCFPGIITVFRRHEHITQLPGPRRHEECFTIQRFRASFSPTVLLLVEIEAGGRRELDARCSSLRRSADFFGAFDLNDVTSQERLGARVKTNLDYYSGNYIALTAFVLMVRSRPFCCGTYISHPCGRSALSCICQSLCCC